MKVITRVVDIENKQFVLIFDEQNGQKFYGTIPYDELTASGCTKRALNGFEMCISDTIPGALERRMRYIAIDNFIKEGHTEAELFNFVLSL